jgi:lactoylglutathione lyase
MKMTIEGTVNGKLKSMDWKLERVGNKAVATKTLGENQMLHGLRTVVYKVKDLPKAKQWYTDVLGFGPYFDEPYYVGFNVGGFELGLDPDAASMTIGTNIAVYWGVDNCQDTYAKLLEKGATKHAEPQEVGGGIIVATVLDPFGNVFGVIENPHFKF